MNKKNVNLLKHVYFSLGRMLFIGKSANDVPAKPSIPSQKRTSKEHLAVLWGPTVVCYDMDQHHTFYTW